MTIAESAPLLLRVPEAAGLLGIAPSHLWRLIADGRVPVVKIGRSTRVRRQDVEAFIEALREEA